MKKHTILLASAMLFGCLMNYGQTPNFRRSMLEQNATFYGVQQNAKMFFQNFTDTSEGGGQMGYGRWEQWWSTRVSGQDGTFKSAFDAVSLLLQTPICTTSSVPSLWTTLGPGVTALRGLWPTVREFK